MAHLERSFADPDHRLPGGESAAEATLRAGRALDAIAARHPGQTVVAAGHGNLIALALRAHDPSVGFAFWRAMPMPAVFELSLGSVSL